jgi:hypothetical protein
MIIVSLMTAYKSMPARSQQRLQCRRQGFGRNASMLFDALVKLSASALEPAYSASNWPTLEAMPWRHAWIVQLLPASLRRTDESPVRLFKADPCLLLLAVNAVSK